MSWRAPAGLLAATLVSVAACGNTETTVYEATDIRAPTTPAPTKTTTTTSLPPAPIVIERLWSPSNALAELIGTGATADDPITVDGDEGAHTVCIRDECGRVYVLDADAETVEQAEAKIEEAVPLAKDLFDFETEFPEWSIKIAGPLSGTGGSTDIENRSVIIYANRNREPDDYVTTILHEWGHVVDEVRLTDEERTEYRLLRGIDPELPWRTPSAHSIEEWAMQPSEDFAEVMVAVWSDGRVIPRTTQIAPAPDEATLVAVAAFAAT